MGARGDSRGCERVYSPDAKVNCIKLNKINRKLNQVIRILETNDGNYPGDYKKVEYTCKARVLNNKFFEGYGRTSKEAQYSFSTCEKVYGKYSCTRSGNIV